MDHRELMTLSGQLHNYLEYIASLGVESMPVAETDPGRVLEDIRGYLGVCTRCGLHETRNHIVFGEGPPDARIMFVGEGPGREEDLQGRPFVGRAGQMLTDIIVKGMKLSREQVYIANVVKCRPPENRDPLPEEARTCLPFLRMQVDAIKPAVICALGRVAAHNLLGTTAPLGRLRHRFHDFHGIPVMPTYHPSALLRDPNKKRDVWEDIKLILARLAALPDDDKHLPH